ncbi:MAG: hypothetical protein KAT78_02700 [Flavobacteriaceae bacterium]|nr:hypothetical protein [Flavobacteriaceae bacterium]
MKKFINKKNMKARILIYSGVYAILGILLAKKLVFFYNYGTEGITVLPINFFEILLFVLTILIVSITLLTIFILAKKREIKISNKIKMHLFLSLVVGGFILFLVLQFGYNQIFVSVILITYGTILLNLNRLIDNRLLFLAIAEIVLGIIILFVENNTWLFLILGLGVLPILFGMINLSKKKFIF